MPGSPGERAEVRRLIDWYLGKMEAEVTGYLVTEKVYKRRMSVSEGGGPPDAAAIRAARANIRYHLGYIAYLTARRSCLAGTRHHRSPTSPPGRRSRWSTISAKCRGRRKRRRRPGTRG